MNQTAVYLVMLFLSKISIDQFTPTSLSTEQTRLLFPEICNDDEPILFYGIINMEIFEQGDVRKTLIATFDRNVYLFTVVDAKVTASYRFSNFDGLPNCLCLPDFSQETVIIGTSDRGLLSVKLTKKTDISFTSIDNQAVSCNDTSEPLITSNFNLTGRIGVITFDDGDSSIASSFTSQISDYQTNHTSERIDKPAESCNGAVTAMTLLITGGGKYVISGRYSGDLMIHSLDNKKFTNKWSTVMNSPILGLRVIKKEPNIFLRVVTQTGVTCYKIIESDIF